MFSFPCFKSKSKGHFLENPLLIAQVDIEVEGKGEIREDIRNHILFIRLEFVSWNLFGFWCLGFGI